MEVATASEVDTCVAWYLSWEETTNEKLVPPSVHVAMTWAKTKPSW